MCQWSSKLLPNPDAGFCAHLCYVNIKRWRNENDLVVRIHETLQSLEGGGDSQYAQFDAVAATDPCKSLAEFSGRRHPK